MELLICDDCSSDTTPVQIDEWLKKEGTKFERVVFIKHEKNQGITHSLNELIAECRGELISPLASDDFLLEGAIKARRKSLESYPLWMGAFSDGLAIGLQNEIYSESILASSGIDSESLQPFKIKKTILQNWVEPMNLQFWRRTAFKLHGGEFEFDGSVFCEDLNFALWALAKNSFGYLDKKCVAYRCRTWPQVSSAKDPSELRDKYKDMSICYAASSAFYEEKYSRYMNDKSLYFYYLSLNNKNKISDQYKKIAFGVVNTFFYYIYIFFWKISPYMTYRLCGDIVWWKKYLVKRHSNISYLNNY